MRALMHSFTPEDGEGTQAYGRHPERHHGQLVPRQAGGLGLGLGRRLQGQYACGRSCREQIRIVLTGLIRTVREYGN